MHGRCLGSQVSPLWRTCCVLLLLPKFSHAELPFALTSHIQIERSTTKGCLTRKTRISPYLKCDFPEEWRENTSFSCVSVHNIARPNYVASWWHCQTFQLFLQEGWVQTSKSIGLPENVWMSSSELRLFNLICSQAQTTKAPFSSATNRENSGHMVSKDASLSVLEETEWQVPNEHVKSRD